MRFKKTTRLPYYNLIFGISIFLAIFYFFLLHTYSLILYSDNAIYAILSERFASGDYLHALHIWWQPLYPFFGSFFFHYSKQAEISLFVTSLFAEVGLFIPVFFLTILYTNSKPFAVAAGILVSSATPLLGLVIALLSENLFIFLLTCSITFIAYGLNKNKEIYFSFAGLFFGLAYLTRNEGVIFLAISLLLVFLIGITKKELFLNNIKLCLITFIFFCIICSPYFLFNVSRFGYFNFAAKSNASLQVGDPFKLNASYTSTFAQEIWSVDTPNYASVYFKPSHETVNKQTLFQDSLVRAKSYIFYFFQNFSLVILLFFLGFILSFYIYRKKPEMIYIHFLIGISVFLYLPLLPQAEPRYMYWLIPFILFFAVLCMYFLYEFLSKKPLRLVVMASLMIWVLESILIPRNYMTKNITTYKTVGTFIQSQHLYTSRIMTRTEAFSFYAKGVTIYIPTSINLTGLRQYAMLWKVNYIIADRATFQDGTLLSVLNSDKFSRPWLKRIKVWNNTKTKVILYKVI